jgi:tryptophanyl-tRNA synthetase
VFKRPEPLILPEVETVPGIDGQKMSKSYKNTIPLFASNEEIAKAVMSIVTDSASGVPTNVYNIHKLFRGKTELDVLYEEKKGKYKDLKDALIADLIVFIAPLRERREALAKDPAYVLSILEKGAHKARARAQAKMKIVREKVGLSY